MPTKKSSAAKRHKQSEVSRMRNKSVKSAVRTCAKKYASSVAAKNSEEAASRLRELYSELDVAARKGIIHKNAAARKKSRMQKLYNKTFTA